MTKGDNNNITDLVLYPPGQTYVHREQIVGLVKGYIPCVGRITIAFRDTPWLKLLAIIGALLLSVLGKLMPR